MARLLSVQRGSGALWGERVSRRAVCSGARSFGNRQAGGPYGVGNDASDRECVLQLVDERDRVSSWHFAAAFLRPETRRCDELWRNRRGDWARDDARF